MDKNSKIFVAGHRGLVGGAILRELQRQGYDNLVTLARSELDLTDAQAVRRFFDKEKVQFVFVAAAKVGGILANNTYPGDFIRDNLQIQTNVIDAAYKGGCEKLLFLGSSCIYPKFAEQPIKEAALLTGALEPTNEPYAIAKIAGILMCQSYRRQYGFDAISLMPTNLYGPGDNFDPENSHVLAALLRRIHEAKLADAPEVVVWGTGAPTREFLHCADLANACVYMMSNYSQPEIVNIGTGEETSIRELAELICSVVGYKGALTFDTSKPDGTPRKVMDVSKAAEAGWRAQTQLRDGLVETYRWFVEQNPESMRLQEKKPV